MSIPVHTVVDAIGPWRVLETADGKYLAANVDVLPCLYITNKTTKEAATQAIMDRICKEITTGLEPEEEPAVKRCTTPHLVREFASLRVALSTMGERLPAQWNRLDDVVTELRSRGVLD